MGVSGWRAWAPMLVTPLLALSEQSVVYALATPLCARQAGVWIHAVFAMFFAVAAALVAVAWAERRRLQRLADVPGAHDDDRRGRQPLFLAEVATGVAAIAALSLLAMWIPQAMLSPCQS
jgi:hypothetical protein